MFKAYKFLLILVLFISLGACDSKSTIVAEKGKPELPPTLTVYAKKNIPTDKRFAIVAIGNELGVLYQDKGSFIFYKNGVSTTIATDQKSAGHFWLHYDGRRIYALWWRKFNADKKGKQLFISVSEDQGKNFSTPKVLNNDFGVLPTISIASDGDNVIVTYHDERQPGVFKVYANISSDGGRTWLSNDILVDQESVQMSSDKRKLNSAVAPSAFVLDKKFVVLWLQLNSHGFYLNSRAYDLANQSWSAIKVVYSNPELLDTEYKAYKSGNKLIALIDGKKEGLLAFISGATGATWKALGSNYSKMTDKPGVSFLSLATSKDRAYVITTREYPNKKPSIDLSVISLSEEKWIGEPQEFDRYKDHKLTRSTNPMIGALDDGTLIAVWDDYRHILSTVYFDMKKPGDEKWLEKPQPLTAPGFYNLNLSDLIMGDTKAWVIIKGSKSNGKKLVNEFYVQEISKGANGSVTISNPPVMPVSLTKKELEKRLEKRVKEFWALRAKGDMKATWDYFDPLYRLKFGKQNWLKTQGKINFGDFKSDKVEIKNDIFGVSTGSVPIGMNLLGVKEGVLEASPLVEKTVNTKWGWFYDDWYFMPSSFFMRVHNY